MAASTISSASAAYYPYTQPPPAAAQGPTRLSPSDFPSGLSSVTADRISRSYVRRDSAPAIWPPLPSPRSSSMPPDVASAASTQYTHPTHYRRRTDPSASSSRVPSPTASGAPSPPASTAAQGPPPPASAAGQAGAPPAVFSTPYPYQPPTTSYGPIPFDYPTHYRSLWSLYTLACQQCRTMTASLMKYETQIATVTTQLRTAQETKADAERQLVDEEKKLTAAERKIRRMRNERDDTLEDLREENSALRQRCADERRMGKRRAMELEDEVERLREELIKVRSEKGKYQAFVTDGEDTDVESS